MKTSINEENFSLNSCSIMSAALMFRFLTARALKLFKFSFCWMNELLKIRLLETFYSALFQKFFILLSGEIYITV